MRPEHRPQNESREHWRLKRMGRHILWGMGCWAVTYEFYLAKIYRENCTPGRAHRTTADLAGIMATRVNNTKLGLFGRHLGLVVAECKATVGDLRAGMITKGGHWHYALVPEKLAAEAVGILPKWVGVLGVDMEDRTAKSYHYTRLRTARPARRQDDAVVPLWSREASLQQAPDGWVPVLMQFACGQTRYALRWRA